MPSVPYGAVDGGIPGQAGPPPDQRLTGDLEIRPNLVNIAVGLMGVVAIVVGTFVKTESLVATGVLGAVAAVVWVAWALYALVGRVRVVGDTIEIRLLGRHVVVPLAELERPVRMSSRNHGRRLHLRLRGGQHLTTLGSQTWRTGPLGLLGERLGAVDVATGLRIPEIERRYPGTFSVWGRHPVVLVLTAMALLIAAMTVAILVSA